MNTPAVLGFISAGLAAALALASALRARRQLARWAFVGGMLVFAAERTCSALAALAAGPDVLADWHRWRMLALSLVPGTWLLFSLSYARGNAREFLVRWRTVLIAAFAGPPLVCLLGRDSLIIAYHEVVPTNDYLLSIGLPGGALYVTLLITAVLVLTNLERTYRASVGTMRWRVKYMLFGVGLLFIVRMYSASQVLLFRGISPSLELLNSAALVVAIALLLRSLFRTGHFDLDLYPSQSVLQGSVTVLLAGIYLLIVGAFAKVVAFLGGDAAFTFKAFGVLVLVVLLAILLQSDRARLRIRRFISRNFQRPLYDYRAVWTRFAGATATRLDRNDLCRSLVKVVADIFQALSVTIWLVDEKQESMTLAASTSLSDGQAGVLHPLGTDAAEVIRHLRQDREPVDIELSQEAWAVALRRCHPDEFHKGGSRVCVPIHGGGELLAVVVLGDRVSGTAFSLQDFDLLKCIGEQAAASLLNLRLSERLLQARELEAFQTMAAFFVHDLKNAASTLNLMLQNLPVHFNDPAFREDALRGIGKTVTHINGLIGRLSLLRHELKLQPVEMDLNAVVERTLGGLELPAHATLARELGVLPKVPLDGDQIAKVITNLILNAGEAVAANGRIRVATERVDNGVVLAVADNGCGMSPEFVQRSLFRPFQTTKKGGIGIGMFQSKMIVEAHGGRVEVASEPGKGTTFRVFLPVAHPHGTRPPL